MSLRRLALLAGLLVAIASVALVATRRPDRPATRYDVHAWSVAIPNDLALEPLAARDPALVWREGPGILLDDSTPPRSFTIQVRPYPARGSDAATVRAALDELLVRAGASGAPQPTERPYPAGAGASVHARDEEHEVDVVYVYNEGRLAMFLGTGLGLPEVEGIAETFRFRVPPGDPEHPPSSAPSSAG